MAQLFVIIILGTRQMWGGGNPRQSILEYMKSHRYETSGIVGLYSLGKKTFKLIMYTSLKLMQFDTTAL